MWRFPGQELIKPCLLPKKLEEELELEASIEPAEAGAEQDLELEAESVSFDQSSESKVEPSSTDGAGPSPEGKQSKFGGKRKIILLAGTLALVVAAAGGGLWYLNSESPPDSEAKEANLASEETMSPSSPPAPGAKGAQAESPALSPLARIGTLDYGALQQELAQKATTAELAAAHAWARFRARLVFETPPNASRAPLKKGKAPRKKDLPAQVAATIGVLHLEGQGRLARSHGERLWRSYRKPSPQLAFALATAYASTKADKALELLDYATEEEASMLDAQLLALALRAPHDPPEQTVKEALGLLNAHARPDVVVRVARAIEAAEIPAPLPKMLASLPSLEELENIGPGLRSDALRYLTTKLILQGNLKDATRAATVRLLENPTDLEAIFQASSMLQQSGALGDRPYYDPQNMDAGDALRYGLTHLKSDESRAAVTARLVRLRLEEKDLGAAERAVGFFLKLRGKKAKAWEHFARALIAVDRDQRKEAMRRLQRAMRGPQGVGEARALYTLLEQGHDLQALASVVESTDNSRTRFALAQELHRRKRYLEARTHLEKLLWKDAAAVRILPLILIWADSVAHLEPDSDMLAVLDPLRKSDASDPRPVEQMIVLARRKGDFERATTLFQDLLRIDRGEQPSSEAKEEPVAQKDAPQEPDSGETPSPESKTVQEADAPQDPDPQSPKAP